MPAAAAKEISWEDEEKSREAGPMWDKSLNLLNHSSNSLNLLKHNDGKSHRGSSINTTTVDLSH